MGKVYVDRYDPLWKHTMMRIKNAKDKCTVNGVLDYEKFKGQMITRLIRIGKDEKIHYAMAALIESGYKEIAEIYDGRLLMDVLVGDWGEKS